MIKLNLEDSGVSHLIDEYNEQVKYLASKMERGASVGAEFLGWKDLPIQDNPAQITKINKIVKTLHDNNVETLVVIGIGGSFSGAKAAIEMIKGLYPIANSKVSELEIIFLGESLSSTALVQKLNYLSKKNYAINVISKSGTTIEPAIAFRILKKALEAKVGKGNAHKYIIATTDANNGALLKLAKHHDYQTFVIPDNIGGRFSVLTAVGLFPMACAGINIKDVLKGARNAHKKYSDINLKQNEAYQYAVARYLLGKKKPIELMIQYETQMQAFSEWWKQLAGESEGKNEKGLFPASAIFSTDLHSLGQFIQQGSKILFETVLFFKHPILDCRLPNDEDNFDDLNKSVDLTVHQINEIIYQASQKAHHNVAKVPIIELMCDGLYSETFGELVIFFERAVAMTAYLLDVNPFNQPGVEIYKQNMMDILENS